MPVRNEKACIERSISSVLSQDYPPDRIEVLIADGGSEDGTRELLDGLRQGQANLRIVDNPKRIVATALNAALREAKGEVIVRVDGHCQIAPEYVRQCVAHLVHDQIEAVGGPVETVGESYVARVIAASMSSRFGVGGSAFRVANRRTQFTDTVAFPAYTRSVIDRAGAFDEELVRNQDDEYNYRLRKLGVRILLASDVRSRYFSRATLPGLWKQYFQYGYWKVRVMQKHPWQMQLRQFAPPMFVLALVMTLSLMPMVTPAGYFGVLFGAAYGLGIVTASAFAARKDGWILLPLLPVAFATLHVSYGLGFLIGLLRFWNRWGQSGNQPLPLAHITPGQL
jgi:glycosyltransferase involved in cell wall biosynthesis